MREQLRLPQVTTKTMNPQLRHTRLHAGPFGVARVAVAEVVQVEVALIPVADADATMEKVKDLSIHLFVGNVQMVIGTMRRKACKVTLDLTPVDGEGITIEVGVKGKVGADMRVREGMAVEVETTVKGIMKLVVGEDETK